MAQAGANIEAFLKLDATGFKDGLKSSENAVSTFKKTIMDVNSQVTKETEKSLKVINSFATSLKELGEDSGTIELGFRNLSKAINTLVNNLVKFDDIQTSTVNRFKTFASGMENLATAAQRLSVVMQRGGQGIEALNSIMDAFQTGMSSVQNTIKLTATQFETLKSSMDLNATSSEKVANTYVQSKQSLALYHQELRGLITDVKTFNSFQGTTATQTERVSAVTRLVGKDLGLYHSELKGLITDVKTFNTFQGTTATQTERVSAVTRLVGRDLGLYHTELRGLIADVETFNSLEGSTAIQTERMGEATRLVGRDLALYHSELRGLITDVETFNSVGNMASAEMDRISTSANRTASNMDKATKSTNRLSGAMRSLRTIGTLVASMMVWNFASSLINATRETVNSKSEMEGYFRMLHFGQSEIDDFNKTLDQTVQRFQRVNKYSLGETISSIGVEFGLTTEEMKKAMTVTSMITSEYLRAGRNANEASLAVKDVLQGQFQRLSRETGVKQENLKDAGWSGDTNDVLGLMEALEKVGLSRHWEVFAEKANSLNDIVTILQNRFGEFTADLIYEVQPGIVNAFNSILSFSEGLSQSLSGFWEWMNGGSWEATAFKIGTFTTSILVLSQMLLQYRTGLGLVEATQLGFTKSLASVVLGLKSEELANVGVLASVKAKILGVKAETLAERGITSAIREKLTMSKMEAVQTKLNTLADENNTVAKKYNAIAEEISKKQKEGLITTTEAQTLQEELNTAQKELNTIATGEQTTANTGLVASLYMLGTGEAIVTGETTALSIAMGVLNGVIALSPVGWLMVGVLALASAFYVLTGGLDSSYATMEKFNEIVKDSRTTIQPYRDELNNTIEEYGAYSDEAKAAQDALDNITQSVEHGTYWAKKYNEEFEGIDAKLDSITQKELGDLGYSDKDIDQVSELHKVMYDGADKDYHALQVLHKQQNDYKKGIGELDKVMDKNNITGEKRNEILERYEGNMANLQKHSALANTGDWWTDMWNSLYAGMDQFWIDWDKFWLDPSWDDIFSDEAMNWFNGVGEWLEGKSLMELIGLDPNYDYVGEWVNSLFGSDPSSASSVIGTYVSGLVDDFENWLCQGILSIPLVSEIAQLFTSLTDEDVGAEEKGRAIGDLIGRGLTWAISQIPIVGDLLQLLGLIPSTNGTANANGKGVGDNVNKGYFSGTDGMIDKASKEIGTLITNIANKAGEAYESAKKVGQSIWNGLNSVLDIHSPGMMSRMISAEFGQYIPNSISSSSDMAYTVAQEYSQKMYEGMNSVNGEFGLGDVVSDYKSDALIVARSSEMMGSETTLAFNDMQLAVNDSTGQMQSNVISSYSAIQQKQSSLLNNMKTSNTTAYNDMYTKSNQSLLQMRDSTSNVTQQMTDSWLHMKDQIIASANKLKTDSTNHFTQLSTTIGNFYRKIQNPSLWGSAGSPMVRQGTPNRRVGRSVASVLKPNGYSGGGKWRGSQTMSIGALKSKVCPTGDCGNIFDGFKNTDVVDVSTFLSMIGGEHGFGWAYDSSHYQYIKNKSDAWKTGSPVINLGGGIGTSTKFNVGDFNNGTPKISFGDFQSMAESIFSTIPYRLYYDSSWKGSWLGALQAGACNCYDGASALLAFANTCGFSGYMAHGSWNGIPHVWAVINGKAMDTTAWQGGYGWTSPKVHGYGSPNIHKSSGGGDFGNKTVHINIDMSNSTIYGVDDLDERIKESTKEAMREEFTDPYTIAL